MSFWCQRGDTSFLFLIKSQPILKYFIQNFEEIWHKCLWNCQSHLKILPHYLVKSKKSLSWKFADATKQTEHETGFLISSVHRIIYHCGCPMNSPNYLISLYAVVEWKPRRASHPLCTRSVPFLVIPEQAEYLPGVVDNANNCGENEVKFMSTRKVDSFYQSLRCCLSEICNFSHVPIRSR